MNRSIQSAEDEIDTRQPLPDVQHLSGVQGLLEQCTRLFALLAIGLDSPEIVQRVGVGRLEIELFRECRFGFFEVTQLK